MFVPSGIAKVVVGIFAAGSIALAGFNAVKPSAPLTPEARYSQAVQQHGEQSKAAARARRDALHRGIDVRTLERLRAKPLIQPPSWFSRIAHRVLKRIPKLRIRLR